MSDPRRGYGRCRKCGKWPGELDGGGQGMCAHCRDMEVRIADVDNPNGDPVPCPGVVHHVRIRGGYRKEHVPCSEECEVCGGEGMIDPEAPTDVQGTARHVIMAIRHAAGLPLWHPRDTPNAPQKPGQKPPEWEVPECGDPGLT